LWLIEPWLHPEQGSWPLAGIEIKNYFFNIAQAVLSSRISIKFKAQTLSNALLSQSRFKWSIAKFFFIPNRKPGTADVVVGLIGTLLGFVWSKKKLSGERS